MEASGREEGRREGRGARVGRASVSPPYGDLGGTNTERKSRHTEGWRGGLGRD
jgi:hypothetical protein